MTVVARGLPGAGSRPVERMDHWRCAVRAPLQSSGFKEWQHFALFTGDVDVLINFSLMNGVQVSANPNAIVPRLVALVRDPQGWRGAVETFGLDDVDVASGNIDARFGCNALRFRGGHYELDLALDTIGVEGALELEPTTDPLLTESIQLGTGGSMRWFVVPRLRANGYLRIDGKEVRVVDSAAYHDHDWGTFRWGGGFAWNWSVSHSEGGGTPWTVTATQITDEGRNRLYTDSLTLWRGNDLVRSFRRESMHVAMEGCLTPVGRPLRVPPIAWLAAPGESFDIPERLIFRAESLGDRVELEIRPGDYAQIAVPAEDGDESTCMLSEIRSDFSACGTVHGESIDLRGSSLLEMMHVVR